VTTWSTGAFTSSQNHANYVRLNFNRE